jgi:peptidoglycan/xylan/chitin deacetylase (PgdA/CDA1 family)
METSPENEYHNMSKPKHSKKRSTKRAAPRRLKKILKKPTKGTLLSFLGAFVVLLGSGLALAFTFPAPRVGFETANFPQALKNQYSILDHNVAVFEKRESSLKSELVSNQTLKNMLSQVQLDAASGNYKLSKHDMVSTQTALDNWDLELNGGSSPAPSPPPPVPIAPTLASDAVGTGPIFLPIVLYHYTPPDFAQQLQYLVDNGYTTVSMAQVAAAIDGGPLPAKPVAITFDDGYENQMQAFALLEQYHMKATFYIINGGAESLWCIGAGRQYNLPIQPKGGCGDQYLTWDQVRQLDTSGLITIGGHTIDHENLATLTPAQQQFEIDASKTGIESEIGHTIYDFAYPYGAYNDATIQLVASAGYRTAVTTQPNNDQNPGEPYILNRIRDTEILP